MLSFAGRSFNTLFEYLGAIEKKLKGIQKEFKSGTLKPEGIASVLEGLKVAKNRAREVESRLRLKEGEEEFREYLSRHDDTPSELYGL